MFLIVILGSTHSNVPAGLAPIAIGLRLKLIYLISIPITQASVNTARSTSQAIVVGARALHRLWLFWIAPIVGSALAGFFHRWMANDDP